MCPRNMSLPDLRNEWRLKSRCFDGRAVYTPLLHNIGALNVLKGATMGNIMLRLFIWKLLIMQVLNASVELAEKMERHCKSCI